MYRTILSHQSVETGGPDKFAIDNIVRHDLSADDKSQIFKIFDTSYYKELNLLSVYKMFSMVNTSLRIYTNKRKEVLISSHFETLDDKGRKVAYMFFHNSSKNPRDICLILSEHASLLGMKINDAELKIINKILVAHSYKKATNTILLCLLLFAIISGISKCGNSRDDNRCSQNLSEYVRQ